MVNYFREFLRLESASGLLLIIAACFAMIAVNSPLSYLYDALLQTPVEIKIGALSIAKPLLLWVNDGLMSIFFFLIGLEVKREFLEGHLSDLENITLPAAAAIGGMFVPALIYVFINFGDEVALRGWAIPSATDIAFTLAILSLLGERVPASLKVFLLTLAIIDDMGAIVVIALFYTADLSVASLSVAAASLFALAMMNRFGVSKVSSYILVGIIMWIAVLKSGVHATLAGVLMALFIPMKTSDSDASPLRQLEHDLHPAVAYIILPFFAFSNTGIPFDGLSWSDLLNPVPLGIALGLFFGNQIGVFGMSWIAVKSGFARLPEGATWSQLYGISMLCGIGFTMSLFIGSLAFEQGGPDVAVDERVGILFGSALSAVCGYFWLRWNLSKNDN